jgi:acyl-CoA thioester hydrolase
MSGTTTATQFEFTIPVDSADIDGLGHVNNIVYLRWVQEAAIAHWQAVASAESQAEVAWVAVRHEIDYKAPAFLGDEILVRTWVGTASGLTFERHTEMLRAADQKLLARARTLWCPINLQTGRPQRVTAELRAQFSADAAVPP